MSLYTNICVLSVFVLLLSFSCFECLCSLFFVMMKEEGKIPKSRNVQNNLRKCLRFLEMTLKEK